MVIKSKPRCTCGAEDLSIYRVHFTPDDRGAVGRVGGMGRAVCSPPSSEALARAEAEQAKRCTCGALRRLP